MLMGFALVALPMPLLTLCFLLLVDVAVDVAFVLGD